MSTPSPTQEAARLVAAGETGRAVAMVEQAAAWDDVEALMRLATWRLIGAPLARDLPLARRYLRRAVTIGHVDAALLEVALTANGSGAEADWAGALRLLRIAAGNDPIAAEQLALIERMDLAEDGSPTVRPTGIQLSDRLDVRRFPGLLTAQECQHVAQVGGPMLEPALVIDPASGRYVPNPVRTSFGAVIGPAHEDLVIRALNARIAAASGTAIEQGEPLQVLRYASGQEYRPHHDALAHTANQRHWTMLVYLNEGYGGGETIFPATGLTVRGRGGDGLLFRNADAAGRPDPLARHAGLPVREGFKWLATRWIRQKPHDPWTAQSED